jgi:hypothetical protein
MHFLYGVTSGASGAKSNLRRRPEGPIVGAVYDRPRCRNRNIAGGHRPPLQLAAAFLVLYCRPTTRT